MRKNPLSLNFVRDQGTEDLLPATSKRFGGGDVVRRVILIFSSNQAHYKIVQYRVYKDS
jgi:hypothetical protein